MSYEDHLYHSVRAQQCRDMADLAADPDVRRRHEELASLHSERAERFEDFGDSNAHLI